MSCSPSWPPCWPSTSSPGSPSSLFSALGVYFSLTTLADGHSLYVTLLYLFAAVYLTANLALLHYNDRIYRDAQPPADEAAPEAGDAKLEERPHEP